MMNILNHVIKQSTFFCNFLTFFLIFNIFPSKNIFSQEADVTISAYKYGKEYKFYAHNPHPCPVQVQVIMPHAFDIIYAHKGYKMTEYLLTIIPPYQKDYHYLSIALVDTTIKKFSYSYHAYLGLPAEKVDSNFVYLLPYEIGTKHFVTQGYNGRFSHRNQHAIDFKMREKTPIRASRGGMVIACKDTSNKRGNKAEFAKYANYIIILHDDNTLAMYYHLAQNGLKVKLGEQVTQGQIIGLSGNTGWSTAPHLHFVVKKNMDNAPPKTIPTLFMGKKGKPIRIKAWNFYRAKY